MKWTAFCAKDDASADDHNDHEDHDDHDPASNKLQ